MSDPQHAIDPEAPAPAVPTRGECPERRSRRHARPPLRGRPHRGRDGLLGHLPRARRLRRARSRDPRSRRPARAAAGAQTFTVKLKDGREFSGRTYGIDTLTDLAIVKIDGEDLPVAPIGDSTALKAGQLAIAIGSPLGSFEITVPDEQTGQPRRLRNLIQTDAAINQGNSGGALVDALGQVIGVNTAVAGSAQGIGFAIPIEGAKPIMRQAVAGEPLSRPYPGIVSTAATPTPL